MSSTTSTRKRLLDAAESLFGESGFERASVRDITAAADANIASAHYHFGSKEGLLTAVLERRISAINGERLHLLEALEAQGSEPTLRQVVEAYVGPPLRAATEPSLGPFMRCMARVHSGSDDHFASALDQQWFRELVTRFRAAIGRCLPGLDEEAIAWRLHLMTGTTAHLILRGSQQVRLADCQPMSLEDSGTLPRLIEFLCGALSAGASNHDTSLP